MVVTTAGVTVVVKLVLDCKAGLVSVVVFWLSVALSVMEGKVTVRIFCVGGDIVALNWKQGFVNMVCIDGFVIVALRGIRRISDTGLVCAKPNTFYVIVE